MRHWLFTNTTYGTWLPGDRRGSVTSVRDRRPDDQITTSRIEHDQPGQPWEESLPGLCRSAVESIKGPPIVLTLPQAESLLLQFQETAEYRGYTLDAVAIMRNHLHWVLTVSGDPVPDRVLADFKAYGSRALNRRFGRPASETWWTSQGSKRILRDPTALQTAIHYVLYKQPHPLVVWSPELGRLV